MGDNTTTTGGTTSGTQASSSQTTKDPWAGMLPALGNVESSSNSVYYGDALGHAIGAIGGYQTPYTTGQAYLTGSPNGITTQQQTPLNQLGGISSGANQVQTGAGYQQLLNQLQPTSAGGLTDTQSQILSDNADRLGNRLASLYSGSGRYNSFGAGIGLARGIAETNNPLMAQFNQQNIGNTLAGLGGLSNVQQQNIGNQMGAANSQLNTYNQGIQNFQRQQQLQQGNLQLALAPEMAQWQGLQNYSGTLGTTYPVLAQDGTITTNANATSSGTTTGQSSTPTPWTTYAGLGLAGIGALSDRRVKTDIKKVGKDPWNGLSIYSYRYKGQPKNTPKFAGPMAQDVREVDPEAVGELPGGILYIKKAA